MTYTASQFLASGRFIELASSEALIVLAKTHKTTVRNIKRDLASSSRLQTQLAELIQSAAEASAKRMSQ